jgi:hypothetical protein
MVDQTVATLEDTKVDQMVAEKDALSAVCLADYLVDERG